MTSARGLVAVAALLLALAGCGDRVGEEHVFVPGPADGDCLVAPLVARTAGGDEVARLPTGTCFGEPIDFVVED